MRTLVLFQEKELTAFFTSMLSGEGKMLTKPDVEKQLKKYDYATASAPDFFFECPHSSAEGITLQEFLSFATSREAFLVKISLPPASVQSTDHTSRSYISKQSSHPLNDVPQPRSHVQSPHNQIFICLNRFACSMNSICLDPLASIVMNSNEHSSLFVLPRPKTSAA